MVLIVLNAPKFPTILLVDRLFVLSEFVSTYKEIADETDNELTERLLPIPVLKRIVDVSRFVAKIDDVFIVDALNAVPVLILMELTINELITIELAKELVKLAYSELSVLACKELTERLFPIPVLNLNVEVSRFVAKIDEVAILDPLKPELELTFNVLTVKVETVKLLPNPLSNVRLLVDT